MVLENGNESHGRIRKKSPTEQIQVDIQVKIPPMVRINKSVGFSGTPGPTLFANHSQNPYKMGIVWGSCYHEGGSYVLGRPLESKLQRKKHRPTEAQEMKNASTKSQPTGDGLMVHQLSHEKT